MSALLPWPFNWKPSVKRNRNDSDRLTDNCLESFFLLFARLLKLLKFLDGRHRLFSNMNQFPHSRKRISHFISSLTDSCINHKVDRMGDIPTKQPTKQPTSHPTNKPTYPAVQQIHSPSIDLSRLHNFRQCFSSFLMITFK